VAELQTERDFEFAALGDPLRFCGHLDCNLSALEALVPVVVRIDGERVRVSGEATAVDAAHEILGRMYEAAAGGSLVTPDDVALAAREVLSGGKNGTRRALPKTVVTTHRGRDIKPRTDGQRAFVEAMERHPLVFAIGPAGTGKTFLAIAMAVRELRDRRVQRIVLTRPAVEAGEKLGFLPGDLKEKVDPYLRPLYDALEILLDENVVARALERGTIEVAPLGYMRGRTLSDAFIILDEAQNATREQLKMFLTRIGPNARMVVTGDVTQIDLPPSVRPGLLDAPKLFADIDEIGIIELGIDDVVRSSLVGKIVAAYAKAR
jgi:phosphate starvation-inducible PhoH-like protein